MTQDQQVVAFMYETDEERWLSFDQENPDCIDCDFKVIPLYATPKSSEGALLDEARSICARHDPNKAYQYLEGQRDDYPPMTMVLDALRAKAGAGHA